MRQVVVDTSVVLAIVINEPTKQTLIDATVGTEIIAPLSLHWEIANALSAMLRRRRFTLSQCIAAIESYKRVPIRLRNVDLQKTLSVAAECGIYAYDAYMIRCALDHDAPLMTLDSGLRAAAKSSGVAVIEVNQ